MIDGEHMTTERIQQKVDNRYGSGGAKVKQIDSNNWEVALTAYPEIIYTMKENIGIGSVVPVPEYKLSDNRMEKVGTFVGPNYFTLEEMKHISYYSGVVEMKWDIREEKEIPQLLNKVENFCDHLQQKYPNIVKDSVINVFFIDSIQPGKDVPERKIAKWGELEDKQISTYLDSAYGERYTYKKSDSLTHTNEIEVRLKDYPYITFYLTVEKSNLGFKQTVFDTRYHDASVYVANQFSLSKYDENSRFLELKAVERPIKTIMQPCFIGMRKTRKNYERKQMIEAKLR